jgi:hypothetical protein
MFFCKYLYVYMYSVCMNACMYLCMHAHTSHKKETQYIMQTECTAMHMAEYVHIHTLHTHTHTPIHTNKYVHACIHSHKHTHQHT